jgi:CRP-like cAMP-binding protein
MSGAVTRRPTGTPGDTPEPSRIQSSSHFSRARIGGGVTPMSSPSEPIRTLDLAEAAALTETPDLEGAYPRFDQAQLEILETSGARRPVQPGEVLFVEGVASESFYVILTGRVAMVEAYGTHEQRVVRVHGPGVSSAN